MRVEGTNIPACAGGSPKQKEALKKELKKEVKPAKIIKRGRFLGRGNCFLLFIIIIFLIISLGAWTIAQTGLVEVPFFSHWFYHEPAPMHWVRLSGESFSPKETIDKAIKNSLVNQIGAVLEEKIQVDLIFTEANLTYLIREANDALNQQNSKIKFYDSQIAINSDRAELFTAIEFINREAKTALTVDFIPQAEDNQIKLKLLKVKIGNLPLPAILGNLAIKLLLEEKIEDISKIIPFGSIISIDLRPGEFIINTELNIREMGEL